VCRQFRKWPDDLPVAFPDQKSTSNYQVIRGRTPCAYAAANVTLKPGQSVTITSAYGQTWDVETFNNVIIPAITARTFVQKKLVEAEELTERLTKGVKMVSGSPLFDGFVKQAYLDNLLRGGLPSIMGEAEDPKVSVELEAAREMTAPFARRPSRHCSVAFAVNASLGYKCDTGTLRYSLPGLLSPPQVHS